MDDSTVEAPDVVTEDVTETVEVPEAPADPVPSQLDRIESAINDLAELVRSVTSTFASRAIDDGAVITDDSDSVEISDDLPDDPYERDYTLD